MAINEDEEQQIVIPPVLPLLAVRDVVVFPNMVLPLFVGRESSVLAIEPPWPTTACCFWPPKKTIRSRIPSRTTSTTSAR